MNVHFRDDEKVFIRNLINALLNFEQHREIEICCYTAIARDGEMTIYEDLVDKDGNTPCEVRKKISGVSIERDGKTICIY